VKTIRIRNDLLKAVRDDLRRPHEFASERVGFLFGRLGNGESEPEIILLYEFQPVLDLGYVDDPRVGARINGAVIQGAMQRAMARKECCFHVHMHDWSGIPVWSRTDIQEIPPIAASCAVVSPGQRHGAVLLSSDRVRALWVDPQSKRVVPIQRITEIGWTTLVHREGN
jgi:hypothetical protein